MSHRGLTTLRLCVLFSGASSLVLEVVWARRLTLFLGTTARAHAAVLGAFMLGLALGALVVGRWSDRVARPLRLYALLEAGVAVYALLSLGLFDRLQSGYAVLAGEAAADGTGLRFLLALGALLVPTFLMGGTFPALVRGVEIVRPGLLRSVSDVYGINTLGAATGALIAGYFLLPVLGVRPAIAVAAATDLVVALVVLAAFRERPGVAIEPAAPDPRPATAAGSRKASRRELSLVLAGFALSGFAALLLQMAWIRALILLLGSSVYAFSTCLAVYLLGLGAGGLIAPRLLPGGAGLRRGLTRAAVIEGAVALAVVAGLPWFERLPGFFLAGYRAGLFDTFAISQLFLFALAASLVFVPTLLLGILFPALSAIWAEQIGAAGRGVGGAYAANTLGAVAGATLGGLAILPSLGLQGSLVLAAGLQLIVAAGYWWLGQRSRGARRGLAGPVVAIAGLVLLVVAVPRWDRRLLVSGPHFNVERWSRATGSGGSGDVGLERLLARQRVLFYEEGADATVAVVETEADRLLIINGKTDASRDGDLPTQVLLAQLPLLAHPEPRSALVIGLGSGITLGSAATHEGLERIDVAEISPEVVAASRLFNEASGFALADERVRLHLADARNLLLAGDERWDVVISEPSNPWISGAANLFTREFFELVHSRLAPGGLAAQWIHTYKLTEDDLRTILATFSDVFPHVTAWLPMAGDLILLGADEPLELDLRRVERALGRPAIREDLLRLDIAAPGDLVRTFLMPARALERFSAGARLNTDARPRIEFSAPRSLYAETTGANLVRLLQHLGDEPVPAPVSGWIASGESGFVSRALGLEIRAGARPEDVEPLWLVRWRPAARSEGGLPALLFDDRRQLEWREGSQRLGVSVSRLEREPGPAELAELTRSRRGGEPLSRGDHVPETGPPGVWELTLEAGDLTTTLAWTCPDRPPRVFRVLATRRAPDPGEELRAATVGELAARFRCLESPAGQRASPSVPRPPAP